MIQPRFLQKGDSIGIVAPGRKLNVEAIERAVKIIESWGFKARVGKHVTSSKHSYLSGSDFERLSDLQEMLNDSSIKAIICARGGYGTTRIVDTLDFSSFLKTPKWICGFSDITALHLALHKLGFQSIHGTMPILFSSVEATMSVESLGNILKGKPDRLEALPHQQNLYGETQGQCVGGNLSLLIDSIGTASEINTINKILIIEEIDEHFYKIDRMLLHLKRAGKLRQLAGLVVGHMTDIKDGDLSFGETVGEIVRYQTTGYNYPIGFNFPTGHANPNRAWAQGAIGKLSVTKSGSSLAF